MKENKFTVGEDDGATVVSSKAGTTSPPKAANAQQHKRPVRHHVKRRSSGKVLVAKLAPIARASSNINVQHHCNDTDSLHDARLTEERPVIMRRSQSQKSLHKMSFERKAFTGLTSTTTKRRKSNASLEKLNILSETTTSTPSSIDDKPKTVISATSPPTPTITKCPATSSDKIAPTQSSISLPLQYISQTKLPATLNPVSISNRKAAEPVEQTFNAMANNLTSADSLKLSTTPTATISSLLTSATPHSSLFKDNHATVNTATHSNTATSSSNNTNNTGKKLLKSQFITPTSDSIPTAYPYNSNGSSDEQSLNESVGREYFCIQRYQDPMRSSLLRCMEKLDIVDTNNSSVRRRLQVGQSMSTSLVPTVFSTSFASSTSTSSSSDNYDSTLTVNSTTFNTSPPIEPHREHKKQIANNRHQHLKAIALSNSNYRQQYQQQFKSHSYNPSSSNTYHHHTTNNAGGGGRLLAALPRNAVTILDKWFSSHSSHSSSNNH